MFFRRTKAHPETNSEQLGGPGRSEAKQRITHNGMKIESDQPPPPGVTRAPGQGIAGLRGLFKGTLQEHHEHRQQQQRRQRGGFAEMDQYLKDGGIYRDDN